MLSEAQKLYNGKVWSRRLSKIDQNESLQNSNRSLQQCRTRRELSGEVRFAKKGLQMWKLLSSEFTAKQVKVAKKGPHGTPTGLHVACTAIRQVMWHPCSRSHGGSKVTRQMICTNSQLISGRVDVQVDQLGIYMWQLGWHFIGKDRIPDLSSTNVSTISGSQWSSHLFLNHIRLCFYLKLLVCLVGKRGESRD